MIIPSVATTAYLPTDRISSGVETKKPLPMIEASGVTVACHLAELRIFGVSRIKNTSRMMAKMMMVIVEFSIHFKQGENHESFDFSSSRWPRKSGIRV